MPSDVIAVLVLYWIAIAGLGLWLAWRSSKLEGRLRDLGGGPE